MQAAADSMEVILAMANNGNPNSITDAGVGALCIRTAVIGAFLNVKINCGDYDDKEFVKEILSKGEKIVSKTCNLENSILEIVNKNMKQHEGNVKEL